MRTPCKNLPEPYQSLFEAMLWDCGAESVPELVRQGADLSYCDPNTGKTALYAATNADRVRCVGILLQYGADPNQKFTYHSPVDGRIEADRIALHYACSAGVAESFIKAGADVNAIDAIGTTPLMCAAFHGHNVVVRTLLSVGASPLARQQKRRGCKARTALEFANVKIEFFQKAIKESLHTKGAERLSCYKEIGDMLLEAESRAAAT